MTDKLGISQNRLAREIGVNPARISEIVHGKGGISATTAIALGLFFGTSPELWLNLQSHYDLKRAERAHGKRLRSRVKELKRAA
ncbi:MAG: HigA family addiction module antidote protein [Betaproteobacteria bacterium]|nr:HigA family addiction module antidote protein [Betaproteobacteria bacterium]